MEAWDLVVLGGAVLAYSAVSGRLRHSVITAALFFTTVGLVAGEVFDRFGAAGSREGLTALATAALTLVLFDDSERVDLARLRRDRSGAVRLLGVALPLAVGFGAVAALVVFDGVGLWPAAVLAAVLAPTDSALCGPAVTEPAVPARIRHWLTIESGMNDGLCVPLVAIFLALAEAEEAVNGRSAVTVIAQEVGWGVVGGLAAGVVGAAVFRVAGRRGWMEETGRQIALLAVPVIAFGVAAALHGSGFLAAFVAGATVRALAADRLPVPHLVEGLGTALTGATFVVFGAIALGPALRDLDGRIVLYAVISLTLVRGGAVALAYLGSGVQARTVAYLGWFGPRGLVSIVLALAVIEDSALRETNVIVATVAVTVGLSVLVHGVTALPGARAYAAWYTTHPDRHELEEHR